MRLVWILGITIAVSSASLHAASSDGHQRSPVRNLEPLSDVGALGTAFRNAIQTLQNGDHKTAINLLTGIARQGHAEAQFTLGVIYAMGRGAAKDTAQAIEWWQMAAAQRHLPSLYNLGWLYGQGAKADRDYAKARGYWQQAADAGDADSQFQLGLLAVLGEDRPVNYQEAERWWKLAAAQGNQDALKGLEILKTHGAIGGDAENVETSQQSNAPQSDITNF